MRIRVIIALAVIGMIVATVMAVRNQKPVTEHTEALPAVAKGREPATMKAENIRDLPIETAKKQAVAPHSPAADTSPAHGVRRQPREAVGVSVDGDGTLRRG